MARVHDRDRRTVQGRSPARDPTIRSAARIALSSREDRLVLQPSSAFDVGARWASGLALSEPATGPVVLAVLDHAGTPAIPGPPTERRQLNLGADSCRVEGRRTGPDSPAAKSGWRRCRETVICRRHRQQLADSSVSGRRGVDTTRRETTTRMRPARHLDGWLLAYARATVAPPVGGHPARRGPLGGWCALP